MRIFYLILTTFASPPDSWFCTQESSKLVGSTVLSCGIGEAKTEEEARAKAFESARNEFARLCSVSSNCKTHKISVEPKRTSCTYGGTLYKCYRLLNFTVSDDIEDLSTEKTPVAPALIEPKPEITKLKVGMPKEDLMRMFGMPHEVTKGGSLGGGGEYEQWFYRGSMCVYESCYVIIVKDKVESWEHILPGFFL